MTRSKTIYFADAVTWLRCQPSWLTKQIDAERVRFTLENDGKGANRYVLNRDDVECLLNTVPEFKMKDAKEIRTTPSMQRKALKRAELENEARALGMTLSEYKETCM